MLVRRIHGWKAARRLEVLCSIAVNDKKKDELSVHGFVRYQWHELQINEQLFPPRYLIQIMRRYYHNEYVHLFHVHQDTHWKINVFDILCD